MKIAVVIVTFDAPQILKRHLDLLRKQTRRPDCVFIVNTGETDIGWAVGRCCGEFPVRILRFGDIGPAGGFREGAKRAFAEGFDYIIYADDDALPVDGQTMEYCHQNARKGREAVVGQYSNRTPIHIVNHYMMLSRGLIGRVGFHHSPFFMMWEDTEYAQRMMRECEIFFDRRITIHHPFTITSDSLRCYYDVRNGLVHFARMGEFAPFIQHAYGNLIESVSIALFLRKTEYLGAFLGGVHDFAAGRMGKKETAAVKMNLEEAAGGRIDGGEGVFTSWGAHNTELPGTSGTLELLDTRTDLARAEEDGGKTRRIWPISTFATALWLMRKLGGKDIVLTNQLKIGLPPFSLLAKRIYVWDLKRKKLLFLYRNDPLIAAFSMLVAMPAMALITPPIIAAYLLRRRHYQDHFISEREEDCRFCIGASGKNALRGSGLARRG